MGELGGASQRWMIGWRNAQLRAAAGNASMVGVEVREIKWLPPPQGWVKINTDGAVKMTNGYAGEGLWFVTIMRTGWRAALAISDVRRWRKLKCGAYMMACCCPGGKADRLCTGLGRATRALMDRPWKVKVEHVYRKGNQVADILTRLAADHERGLQMFL
ncbi:hypothetical protein V6Z11_D11G057900 [Gossypium hirsutum]